MLEGVNLTVSHKPVTGIKYLIIITAIASSEFMIILNWVYLMHYRILFYSTQMNSFIFFYQISTCYGLKEIYKTDIRITKSKGTLPPINQINQMEKPSQGILVRFSEIYLRNSRNYK